MIIFKTHINAGTKKEATDKLRKMLKEYRFYGYKEIKMEPTGDGSWKCEVVI